MVLSVKEAIEQRRAARSFRSDPIPLDILNEIFRLGMRSPSGFNLQPWRFIVLKSPENKEKLRACAFDQRQITEAPVVLICCGDRTCGSPEYIEKIIDLGTQAQAMNEGYASYIRQAIPQLFEYQPSFTSLETWTNRHTMLAVAHIMIAACSLGVDSCPMEGFIATEVRKAFAIPDNLDICCLLPLGYSQEPFKQYGGRFEIDQVFFQESFGQS